MFVYSIVFTAGSYYLFKLAWAGPSEGEGPPPYKPKLATWMASGKGDVAAVEARG